MHEIDPITLVFTAGLMSLMAGGALFILRTSLPSKVHGIRPWAFAMLLGWVSAALRWEHGALPDFFSLVVSNAVLMMALGLILYGLRRFNGHAPRMTPIWVFSAMMLALIAWFSLVHDVFYLRVVITCAYGLVIFPLATQRCFRAKTCV